MKFLELEEPEDNGWKEWLIIKDEYSESISFSRDYQRPNGPRKTWNDEGIVISKKHIPEIINFLKELIE